MYNNIAPILRSARSDEYFSRPLRAAIFMSGSGSNAERLLETRLPLQANWVPAALVTDYPDTSRAMELAERYSIPLINADIKSFYARHGLPNTSLGTVHGRQVRDLWTEELHQKLTKQDIDFGILAGFISMTNITGYFPCLNVHPGDLTVTDHGVRLLTGLHTLPVETALLRGFKSLRSSVILAQPYVDIDGDMDTGPILGISAPMPINFDGAAIGDLIEIKRRRPQPRPRGGYQDQLAKLAAALQEQLKVAGDWELFPPLVADFAAGKFCIEESGQLLFYDDGGWHKIKTVEYTSSGRNLIYE